MYQTSELIPLSSQVPSVPSLAMPHRVTDAGTIIAVHGFDNPGKSGPVPVMVEFGLSPEVLEAFKKRLSEAQRAALRGNGPSWHFVRAKPGVDQQWLLP